MKKKPPAIQEDSKASILSEVSHYASGYTGPSWSHAQNMTHLKQGMVPFSQGQRTSYSAPSMMSNAMNSMAPMFMSAPPPTAYHPQEFTPYMPNGGHALPSNPSFPPNYFSSAMQAMI